MRLMRSIGLVGLAVGAIALGGCNLPVPGGTVTNQQVNDAIIKVQDATKQACGYLPAVQTVTGILATFVSSTAPVIESLNAIANGICSSVTAKSARKLAGPPTYRGVVIRGEFVGK